MVAGLNRPEITAREEANTVIGEKQDEFVAAVNSWSDIVDIQQKKVRMYIDNRILKITISSDSDRHNGQIAFKNASYILKSPI